MKKKMLFIYNPKAGKAQIKNQLYDILDVFTKGGYFVTAYPTQAAGDAMRLMEELPDEYDIIVCSGGDGTLDEVVTGMMKSGKTLPLGYIPAGSTNDFATSLGLPKNMKEAAETVVSGEVFPCDIGVFNQDVFVYVAGVGLFTNVSYETKQETKNVLGHMAYVVEGIKALPSIKSYHFKITYGDECIEDDFVFCMITNSTSVGGFKRLTGKNVSLNDGLFEVTLIKLPRNPLELNDLVTALFNQQMDAKCMYCFKTDHIVLESDEPLPWTLDGEFGGNHTKVDIRNCAKAVEIMVPSEKERK